MTDLKLDPKTIKIIQDMSRFRPLMTMPTMSCSPPLIRLKRRNATSGS